MQYQQTPCVFACLFTYYCTTTNPQGLISHPVSRFSYLVVVVYIGNDGPTYKLLNNMKRQCNIINWFVNLKARVADEAEDEEGKDNDEMVHSTLLM